MEFYKKYKIIHNLWNDYILIDFNNNKIFRESIIEETGNIEIYKNFLVINWDKWDKEFFIFTNNILYKCDEIHYFHEDWNTICYYDSFNNFIYRKENYGNTDNDRKGFIENICSGDDDNIENDELKITWEPWESEIILQQNKIPNIIHFIYGLKPQNEEFELYKYISIKSAYDVNKPEKIYFYYKYEPYGYWWEKIKSLLTLEYLEPPQQIFNNVVSHYAHQTDIIRLEKLIERGGIYLDIDTICLKPMTDLLCNDLVMGKQINSDNTQIYGLCNAVLLSVPNSFFLKKWYNSYKNFRSKGRDEYWDEHSVKKPLELSMEFRNDIKILEYNSFFYPLWYDINKILFNKDLNEENIKNYKNIISNNYCIHLWDTYTNKYLKTLTENIIFEENTLYNIFSRKFLRNQISIVFLTYNRFFMTKKCLESYLVSLDKEYIEELIIFDNDSNRDLTDYLLEFKDKHHKIKIIFNDDNIGVCNGRRILFEEAIGDIIVSLDSDAYLLNPHFFQKIIDLLYNETHGIIGISGAFLKDWSFGSQEDIDDNDPKEYYVHHIAGCCQAFRKDLHAFGFGLDPFYGKFWVEDTDLSMQSLYLSKKNLRIPQIDNIDHHWGGSGAVFKDIFRKNWDYFCGKWKDKIKL